MKVKRVVALIIIFSLLGVATVFGDTIYVNYTAKKVAVKVNGSTIDGLEVDMVRGGTVKQTMVPLEEIVNSLGGIINVSESGAITIYKPNVQLSVVTPKELKNFQSVEKGKNDLKVPFRVFGFIDSIKTNIGFFKITVHDPFGEEIESQIETFKKEDQVNEVYKYLSNPLEITMKSSGKYTVNLLVKEVDGTKYYKVGEIAIYAVAK